MSTTSRRKSGSTPASSSNAAQQLHQALDSSLENMIESGSDEEMTFTFDGDRIKSTWMVPEMAPTICSICGKGCVEKGLPMCANGNPFCG